MSWMLNQSVSSFLAMESQSLLTSEKIKNSLPPLPQAHRGRKQQHFQRRVDCVNSMVKQFAEGSALTSSSSLAAVNSIKRLVEEKTNGPAKVHPRRAVLI